MRVEFIRVKFGVVGSGVDWGRVRQGHHQALRRSLVATGRLLRRQSSPFFYLGKPGPPYWACFPRISSIRNSWLYFAMRSVRDAEPVLI